MIATILGMSLWLFLALVLVVSWAGIFVGLLTHDWWLDRREQRGRRARAAGRGR